MSSLINKGSGWNFSLEDTTDKCYRDISSELTNNGWNRVAYKRRSKLERKRLPARERADVIWTLNEKDIDFAELTNEQGCNHFENITSLTTKRGFCDLLREVHWNSHDTHDIAPRCYNLGDPIHRDEFIDDFRLTAATNILKWYVLHVQHNQSWCRSCTPRQPTTAPTKSDAYAVPPSATRSSSWRHSIRTPAVQIALPLAPYCDDVNRYSDAEMLSVLQDALTACVWHLRVSKYGEWPEVDISRYFKGREKPLEENQWAKVLDFSYDIAALRCDTQLTDLYDCIDISMLNSSPNERKGGQANAKTGSFTKQKHVSPSQPHFDAYLYKVKSILHCMAVALPQTRHIDGIKNIWVIKAPDSSCGVGIKLHSRLDDILQSERGMGGRTVQKYLESPLLVPLAAYVPLEAASTFHKTPLYTRVNPPPLPLHTPLTKFDMRVWVLVTSFQPLTAYIYSTLYGRRCSTAYDLSVDTLHDSYTHLTNYSVQKKQKLSTAGSSANLRRATDRANSCENSDQDEADLSTSSSAAGSRTDLHTLAVPTVNNTSSKTDANVTRRLRSAVGSARCHSAPAEGGALKRLSEADLLVSHEEIVTTAQRQYLQYLRGTSTLATSVVKRIGHVHDVWDEYLWPLIRHKVLCTLECACESVVPRPRSFEFLGYDVILDASLQPWVLEVNMSPAMAHRSAQQSKLIETMTQGLLGLAVYPHFGSVPAGSEKNETNESESVYGHWEALTPSTVSLSSAPATVSEENTPVETGEVVEEPPVVVLGDWDEIAPPPGTFPKSSGSQRHRRPSSGSALHRKYAHVHTSEAQNEAYFQKFVNAAADNQNRGSVYVPTGNEGIAGNNGTNGATFTANVSSLMAVGSAVSAGAMDKIDSLCSGFGKVLYLQEWWRKRLNGLRKWHKKRRDSCVKIQCTHRQHRARNMLCFLRRQRAAMRIQCFVRLHLARRFVTHIRRQFACTRIQQLYRGVLGRRRFVTVLRQTKRRQIQRWFWYHIVRRKVRASTLIVLRVRAWLQKRKRSAMIIVCALKVNFVARRKRAAKLSRIFYDWLASYKFALNYRLENIRLVATGAAEKAHALLAERRHIQEREWLHMSHEDASMRRVVRQEEGLEVTKEVFEEVLDRAWTVVRKRRLSQQRMSRTAPSAPGLHKPSSAVIAAEAGSDEATSNMNLSAAARRQQAEMRVEQKRKIKSEQTIPKVHNEEFLTQQFVQKKASGSGVRRTAQEDEYPSRFKVGPALHVIPVSATVKPFQHVDNFQFDGDAILQALINGTSESMGASVASSTPSATAETVIESPRQNFSRDSREYTQSSKTTQMTEAPRHNYENLPDPSQLRAMIDAAATPGYIPSPHTPPNKHTSRARPFFQDKSQGQRQGQPSPYYEAHTKVRSAEAPSAVGEQAQWHTNEKRHSSRTSVPERPSVEYVGQQAVYSAVDPLAQAESLQPRRQRRAHLPVDRSRSRTGHIDSAAEVTGSEPAEDHPVGGSAFLFSSALSGHSLKIRDPPVYKNELPNSTPVVDEEPLRRSLDTVTATQRPTKQKAFEQNQVDNKQWFSYDGGTSSRLDSNEAWFLALQRKHAEISKQFNGTAHELPMRKARPQSGSAIRSNSGNASSPSRLQLPLKDGQRKPSFVPHAPSAPSPGSAQSSPNSHTHRKYPVYTHDLLEPHVNPALTERRAPSPPAGFYYTQHTDSSNGKIRPTSAGARYSANVVPTSAHGKGNIDEEIRYHTSVPSRPSRATLGDFYSHAAQAQAPLEPQFNPRQHTPHARPAHAPNTQPVPVAQPARDEYYSHAHAGLSPWDNNTFAPSMSGKYQFDRTPVEAPRSRKIHAHPGTASAPNASRSSKKDKKKVKDRISAVYMG